MTRADHVVMTTTPAEESRILFRPTHTLQSVQDPTLLALCDRTAQTKANKYSVTPMAISVDMCAQVLLQVERTASKRS